LLALTGEIISSAPAIWSLCVCQQVCQETGFVEENKIWQQLHITCHVIRLFPVCTTVMESSKLILNAWSTRGKKTSEIKVVPTSS